MSGMTATIDGIEVTYSSDEELKKITPLIKAFKDMPKRQKPFKSSRYICVRLPIEFTEYLDNKWCVLRMKKFNEFCFVFDDKNEREL